MSNKNGRNALSEINNEILTVYEYCLAAGLTHDEIVEKAKPLILPVQKLEWKRKFLMLLKIGICCLAISYTLSSDTVSRSFLTNTRYFMFKILPFWDWTELYSENCLLENPFYSNEEVLIFDCKVCEDVFDVDYLNRTSPEEISQYYMQRNIPVIVRDAMFDWSVMQDSFNILNMTEGFYHLDEDVCMFQSNLNVENHQMLFQKLLSQDLQKWYAHWENCEKSTQKFVRKFYARPYFLPGVVQMTEANWILMSSNYIGRKYKKIDVMPSVTVMWVAQIRGYNNIQFLPKNPCHTTCNVIEDTLEEGEIALFSPTVWNFSYLPGEGTENLAIAVGGLAI
ncbi:uncharacterized protein [Parasteatoda tepidariorum]|uniref:Uncharacterized protein n=1 Tax=Parasteatoda tepidariorum TaxID=114398 RepID=A0A2L2Y9H4_PARTP|nr:uncharacterized protein LOC107449656 [Parasteatoda tepidariorum]